MEIETEYGPFKSYYSQGFTKDMTDENHPSPIGDPKLRIPIPHEYRVGCSSLTQLYHWFTEGDIKKMLSEG